MKKIHSVTVTAIFISVFAGCQEIQQPSPTTNPALNSISKSTAKKKKSYSMQQSLDNWLKNDWEVKTRDFHPNQTQTPQTTTQNATIPKATSQSTSSAAKPKAAKKEGGFLQYYVDKIKHYNSKSPSIDSTHQKQLNSLPAIGNSSTRR